MNLYSPDYYDAIGPGSDRSAAIVAPLVIDLVRPGSVVDVGCGTGSWLAECVRLLRPADQPSHLPRHAGLDGVSIDPRQLRIDPARFFEVDLSQPFAPGLVRSLGGRFDLALCLEVAEHLSPDRSEGFVRDLCSLADIVLFSAAAPLQGGEGHVNERWPTFWCELFGACGYRLIDPIRKRIWSERGVEPWYQQNMVMYATPSAIAARPRLATEFEHTFPGFLSLVHPRLYGPLVERAGLKPPGPWAPEGLSPAALAGAGVQR